MRSIFFAFRDAPDRRAALRTRGALDRYRLFGMDEIAARGVHVRHNLEHERVPPWSRAVARLANGAVDAAGGPGGDFAAVLPSLRAANACDVVFATVDTVGIPILWLKRLGVVRRPVVYASIGLPERLDRLRNRRAEQRFLDVLRRAGAIVAYAVPEAERLRERLGPGGPPVRFIPFGVDVDAFRPQEGPATHDVVAVGADPRRDFELLVGVARRHPDRSFLIVATRDAIRSLGPLPQNVATESGLPLEAVRDRLANARVVALPVRANSYSGATTTLLQAMAMAKPVVVSRTDAIGSGYGLEDGINCRLVPPGDAAAFDRALAETLTGADAADLLGIRARETVVRSFSWERYTNALCDVLLSAT